MAKFPSYKTSKGFVFEKTYEGWVDEETGLLWPIQFETEGYLLDALKPRMAQANSWSRWVPTKQDFEIAESHGVRELPEMKWSGLLFWTSTPYLNGEYYLFNGDTGTTHGHYYPAQKSKKVAISYVFKVYVLGKPTESEKIKKAKALLKQALEVLE